MKIISHRGNIVGPVSEKENRPSYIDIALNLGYDVEVDVRFADNSIWLGHDEPQYKIEETWMALRKEQIWFHCKDLESAKRLTQNRKYKMFCHTQDSFVLVSTGHLWVHDLNQQIDQTCIIPLLDKLDITKYSHLLNSPYAVCTDYVNIVKRHDTH